MSFQFKKEFLFFIAKLKMEAKLILLILLVNYVSIDSAVVYLHKNQNRLKPVPLSLKKIKYQIENTINDINKALVLPDKNPSSEFYEKPCIWKNCPKPFKAKYSKQKGNVNVDSLIQQLQQQVRKYQTLMKLEDDRVKMSNSKVEPNTQKYRINESNLKKLLELSS